MEEVLEHPWLQKGMTPDTPLMTPSILESSQENAVGKQIIRLVGDCS